TLVIKNLQISHLHCMELYSTFYKHPFQMLSHSSLLTINSLLQQKHTFLMNRNSQSLSRLFWCLNSLSLFRFWFDIFSTHNTNKFISIFPQFLSKFIRA